MAERKRQLEVEQAVCLLGVTARHLVQDVQPKAHMVP
jgi:hypothetical protein